VSTSSIILGKSLAALLPALALTWVAAALFCLGVDAVAGQALLPDSAWLFGRWCSPRCSPSSATRPQWRYPPACWIQGRAEPRGDDGAATAGLLVFQLAGRIALGPRFYFAWPRGSPWPTWR